MPDQKLTRDLQKLTKGSGSSFRKSSLNKEVTSPSNDGAVGTGKVRGRTGGGVSGVLTEPNIGTRTYWPGNVVQSPDGLFYWQEKAIKHIEFEDASGGSLVLNLAQPTPG